MNIKKILRFFPKRIANTIYLHHSKPLLMNRTDEEREQKLKEIYGRKQNRDLDFENPQLFTEKLQWFKLYYTHPDLSRIVCKYEFKNYIQEKLGEGYTVPLYGAWKNVNDIPWDELPKTFVLKSNCQSDGKCIIVVKDKDKYDFNQLKVELNEWLKPKKTLVNSFCRAYYDVTPMILAEKYIEQIDGQLMDYKFFCFDGEPITYKIDFNRFTKHQANYYDTNMNLLSWGEADFPVDPDFDPIEQKIITKDAIEEMISLSRKLSKDFPFVRVDFYYIDNKILLGEMTFYPGGGYIDITMNTEKEWGKLFHLPPKKPLGRKYRTDLDYQAF